MSQPAEIRFVADRMLGRLAKMLRLLGYDTVYSPDTSTPELLNIARAETRVILTRGDAQKRFPGSEHVFSVKSEIAPEQLREVVERYCLDARSRLWSRCTLCNELIVKVEKREVEQEVEPKVFRAYKEFFRCSGCRRVYWRGSHVERILRNLASILSPDPGRRAPPSEY